MSWTARQYKWEQERRRLLDARSYPPTHSSVLSSLLSSLLFGVDGIWESNL